MGKNRREAAVSPVPWRIVSLDPQKGYAPVGMYRVTAEAPPEVVPAVWSHEGCATCGGTGLQWPEFHPDVEVDPYDPPDPIGPCPDGHLVPWSGE